MRRTLRRRAFLSSTVATAGYFVAAGATAQPTPSANGTLGFACIGVGGKGSMNTDSAAKVGNIIALCDIDDSKLAGKAKAHPRAETYFDFRKALQENEKSIDAVVISTPDHTHAAIALMAMRKWKHVYCEKPLCRYLGEARMMVKVAREQKVVTQMGNQSTASHAFRAVLDAVRSGIIGHVSEVHAWTNRPLWPQGEGVKPAVAVEGAPAGIHWDEFIGPAAMRPYSPDFHPFKWRGWWAFGSGALGDMSCHLLNLAFHALDLRNPSTVGARHPGSGNDRETYPKLSVVEWEFPATPRRPPVKLFWYDGGNKPPAALLDGEPLTAGGCLLVGTSGKLLSTDDYNTKWIRLPERQPLAPTQDNQYLARPVSDHFLEFTTAIREGGTTMSNFPDVGAPLTEIGLLGNLAITAGPNNKLAWDAENTRFPRVTSLNDAIHPIYRAGYALK